MSTAPQEEGQSSIVYYPLDMYTLEIYRDDIRSTLPTVGEFGMGILSAKATSEADGTMTLYSGDAWMFLLMILALISTCSALSFRINFVLFKPLLAAYWVCC